MWKWLRKLVTGDDAEADLRRTGSRVSPALNNVRHIPARKKPVRNPDTVDYSPGTDGSVADDAAVSNVLIRNRFVREDTGTHETMMIVDDSILESDDEEGFDPYNTGRFDRSRKWDGRTRK